MLVRIFRLDKMLNGIQMQEIWCWDVGNGLSDRGKCLTDLLGGISQGWSKVRDGKSDFGASVGSLRGGVGVDSCIRWIISRGIYENYRVITLILEKYGNLPLCLENCALFLLPLIFTNILYPYALMHIIYLGEPTGNIISNDHGTFILLCMYWFDPILKKYKWNSFFSLINLSVFLVLSFFLPIIH